MLNFVSRKIFHWIIAFAISMSALAPAVSQALSLVNNGKGFVVEICTTSGTKMTQVIGDEESSSSAAIGSHCPYCVIQSIYLLPSISAFEFVAPQNYIAQSQFVYQSPQILPAWVILPSRAPPPHPKSLS